MATTTTEKPILVVGVDDSEQSVYALEWVLDHFFVPHAPNPPFQLYIVYAKPSVTSAVAFASPGFAEGLPLFDSELKKMAAKAIEQAKQACLSKSGCSGKCKRLLCSSRSLQCVDSEEAQDQTLRQASLAPNSP